MEYIKEQLNNTLNEVKLNIDGEYYRGKVRDNYFLNDKIFRQYFSLFNIHISLPHPLGWSLYCIISGLIYFFN